MVQVTSETDIPSGDHPSSEKSLGQINMEAFHSEFPDQGEWANWPPKWENDAQKGRWEIAAAAVRDQVIEKCAKVADRLSNSASDHEAGAAIGIADDIRALKSSQ